VDARDNALVVAPVYLLNGTQLATGFNDMWDGALLNPIDINQFGLRQVNDSVWTGSNISGIGTFSLGFGFAAGVGHTGPLSNATDWIAWQLAGSNTSHPLYALSSLLSVPVPEPSSWALVYCGALIAGGCVFRRRVMCSRERTDT
jgi:hypothetical protein